MRRARTARRPQRVHAGQFRNGRACVRSRRRYALVCFHPQAPAARRSREPLSHGRHSGLCDDRTRARAVRGEAAEQRAPSRTGAAQNPSAQAHDTKDRPEVGGLISVVAPDVDGAARSTRPRDRYRACGEFARTCSSGRAVAAARCSFAARLGAVSRQSCKRAQTVRRQVARCCATCLSRHRQSEHGLPACGTRPANAQLLGVRADVRARKECPRFKRLAADVRTCPSGTATLAGLPCCAGS